MRSHKYFDFILRISIVSSSLDVWEFNFSWKFKISFDWVWKSSKNYSRVIEDEKWNNLLLTFATFYLRLPNWQKTRKVWLDGKINFPIPTLKSILRCEVLFRKLAKRFGKKVKEYTQFYKRFLLVSVPIHVCWCQYFPLSKCQLSKENSV